MHDSPDVIGDLECTTPLYWSVLAWTSGVIRNDASVQEFAAGVQTIKKIQTVFLARHFCTLPWIVLKCCTLYKSSNVI
jgi:hypothetical protein